jgi:hypothetical protein
MTPKQASKRLKELYPGKGRNKITEAQWAEIERCEDIVYSSRPKQELGYFPPCFNGRTVASVEAEI